MGSKLFIYTVYITKPDLCLLLLSLCPLLTSSNGLLLTFMFHLLSFQLWTLYCDHTKSPGELSTQVTSIVMEFWGKVTPGILHLLTQAKEVNTYKTGLCLTDEKEVNQSLFCIWTVFFCSVFTSDI